MLTQQEKEAAIKCAEKYPSGYGRRFFWKEGINDAGQSDVAAYFIKQYGPELIPFG